MFFGVLIIALSGFSLIGMTLSGPIIQQCIIFQWKSTLRVFLWIIVEARWTCVGRLILRSTDFGFDILSKLVEMGRWMQDAGPSAQEALIAVEEYDSGQT